MEESVMHQYPFLVECCRDGVLRAFKTVVMTRSGGKATPRNS